MLFPMSESQWNLQFLVVPGFLRIQNIFLYRFWDFFIPVLGFFYLDPDLIPLSIYETERESFPTKFIYNENFLSSSWLYCFTIKKFPMLVCNEKNVSANRIKIKSDIQSRITKTVGYATLLTTGSLVQNVVEVCSLYCSEKYGTYRTGT